MDISQIIIIIINLQENNIKMVSNLMDNNLVQDDHNPYKIKTDHNNNKKSVFLTLITQLTGVLN